MVAPLWTQRFTSAFNEPSAVRTTMIGVSPTAEVKKSLGRGASISSPRKCQVGPRPIDFGITKHLHRHMAKALPGPMQHLLHRPRRDCLRHLKAPAVANQGGFTLPTLDCAHLFLLINDTAPDKPFVKP